MVDARVTLAGLWVSVMLTYLLGDVIRIFAGDFTTGQLSGRPAGQGMWLLVAVIMLIPILMVVVTVTSPYSVVRWASMVLAVLLVVFNALGLPYPGLYDNFLIVLSFLLCALIFWFAWTWHLA